MVQLVFWRGNTPTTASTTHALTNPAQVKGACGGGPPQNRAPIIPRPTPNAASDPRDVQNTDAMNSASRMHTSALKTAENNGQDI